MTNRRRMEELSRLFFELSYFNEMEQVPFKPRAYQLASETVTALGPELEETWRRGGIEELMELPSIGKSTAEKIDEYFRTGRIKTRDEFKKKYPVDVWGLSRIEGVGPRHILELYRHVGVRDLEELKHAVAAHLVQKMPRWGVKSEEKLARGLELMERATGRHLLGEILPLAEDIVTALSRIKGVTHCVYAGSLRRRQETVGDIDLLATTKTPKRVMDAFTSLPMVEAIHEKGLTRSSVRLSIGIDADLRVVPDSVFGAALQYFTGDKHHNIVLREVALSQGLTLSEYGLFDLGKKNGTGNGKLIASKTEEDIYSALGLDAPPPEIRVGSDEIDAAREHRLPKLIPYGSVKGDLQVQTYWTDGAASIEDMASAAKATGLSYMAVTDHTKALAFINGLTDHRVIEQGKEIDALNKKRKGFHILKGTECDILVDGSLDLSNKTLATLDWVGISIHSHFKLSREEQTRRIINALSNPYVTCFFHPTGRLIGKREPIDFDMDEVIAAAKKHQVALEIDACPDRSDLQDIHVRAVVRAGVKLVIDTDAHAPEHFRFMPLGEAIARRGWASKNDVLNTKTAKELLAYLDKRRKK